MESSLNKLFDLGHPRVRYTSLARWQLLGMPANGMQLWLMPLSRSCFQPFQLGCPFVAGELLGAYCWDLMACSGLIKLVDPSKDAAPVVSAQVSHSFANVHKDDILVGIAWAWGKKATFSCPFLAKDLNFHIEHVLGARPCSSVCVASARDGNESLAPRQAWRGASRPASALKPRSKRQRLLRLQPGLRGSLPAGFKLLAALACLAQRRP